MRVVSGPGSGFVIGLSCVSGFHCGLDTEVELGSVVVISLVKEIGLLGFIPLPPSLQVSVFTDPS